MPAKKRRPTATNAQPSLRQLRGPILKVAQRHGVTNVRVFGSFARGEQRKSSDIDLLVDLPKGMTLFGLGGLSMDLEEAAGRKVDVIPARSVKPFLRNRIFSEARPL